LIAGSLANFLIAAILFFIVGCILAGVRGTNVIARIADKMPAKEAGMQPGDAIVGISGTYIRLTDDWLKMIRGTEGKIRERKGVTFYVRRRGKEIKCSAKALRKGDRLTGVYGLGEEDVDILTQMISESSGRALLISVRRNGEVLRLPVVPEEREVVDIRSGSELDEESKRGIAGWFARLRGFFTIQVVRKKRGVIGVEFLQMPPKEPVPLTQRLSYGAIMIVRETVDATYALFVLLLKLTQLYHAVGGPIRIFWEIKEHAWLSLVLQLRLIAMLSYVVGLVNLCLPIPPLDGGRLALLGVEAILRRRIDPRWELRMSMAGIALLLAFIAAISMRDIGYIINRLVGSG
ncbi:MAG TPA: hypothetical protein EYP10_03730, partial [Armatimonadetes bacterium]|nr:hypothetical protein [Armatimonadota bacterium]